MKHFFKALTSDGRCCAYLLVRRASVSSLQQNNAHDHGGQESDAGERQSEIHGAVLTMTRLVADRVSLQ